ncbi:MAG: hypothetical protein MUF00_16825 [Gemmatimonadaceae bacterium]|nr:hypothetical protein [Gemmatimonadaceae bacterium]
MWHIVPNRRDGEWTGDWHLQELIQCDSHGEPRHFAVSSTIAEVADRATLRHIRRALLLARAAGIPPVITQGQKQVEAWKGHCSGETKESTFFVLKAKPTEWRFYAIADMHLGVMTFILAVQKKTNKRDRDDFEQCCRAARRFREGAQCADLARFLDM